MLKLRHAAVILTPAGIVAVKDKKDKHILEAVESIENDTTKSDEQKAAALEIVKEGKYSLPGGGPESGESIETTIAREVHEELNLRVEEHSMQKLAEIVGQTRRHVIYLVRATGMISLNPNEPISGIGFIKAKNVFPLIHTFFQTHLLELHGRYFNKLSKEEREARLIQYVSNIRVSEVLIKEWFKDEKRAETYRGKNRHHPSPHLVNSSPNLTIIDMNNKPLPPPETSSLTQASRAVFIPRQLGNFPGIAKAIKRPSSSTMQVIRTPSARKLKAAQEQAVDESKIVNTPSEPPEITPSEEKPEDQAYSPGVNEKQTGQK